MWITRIAPSPTGFAHLGTFRTAYFNWLAARSSGGKFILRIDDTDDARDREDYVKPIYETMSWLGLDYDMTFRQSDPDRRRVHLDLAEDLLKKNRARVIEGGAIALNYDDSVPNHWIDSIAGRVSVTESDIKNNLSNLVIVRSSGTPTYHWSSTVDDISTGVNWVIRGTDHISNTSKHLLIYHALGATIPKYSHIGLVNFQGKKLSKRENAASMTYYRDLGYNKDAMLNFMLRLGWGPKVDDRTTALLPRERALELFLNDGNMKSSPSNLDMAKLDSFDRKYKAILEKQTRSISN